jgi:hypothetical protein
LDRLSRLALSTNRVNDAYHVLMGFFGFFVQP